MKIIETIDITLEGIGDIIDVQEFWVEDDAGVRTLVQIPDVPAIIEQFRWLSDNDCLRHLRQLKPSVNTNERDIAAVERSNAMIEENAYATVFKGKDKYVDPHTTYQNWLSKNIKPVPDPSWKATWKFWSKDRGIQFKLAMGGK